MIEGSNCCVQISPRCCWPLGQSVGNTPIRSLTDACSLTVYKISKKNLEYIKDLRIVIIKVQELPYQRRVSDERPRRSIGWRLYRPSAQIQSSFFDIHILHTQKFRSSLNLIRHQGHIIYRDAFVE